MYKTIKQSIRTLFIALSSIFLIMIASSPITEATGSELNFQVEPIFPKSQIDGQNQYFDLVMQPGTTDKLELLLKNPSAKQVDILITPHTAFTNVNGVVEYGKNATHPNKTVPFEFAELLDLPGPITLAASEKKKITIPIHLPKKAFSGVAAGGLKIEEVKKNKDKKSDEGIAINNSFAYVLGIVISNTPQREVLPELELTKVFPDQLNYHNVISATIQNKTPAFVNKLHVEATIYQKGSTKKLFEAKTDKMQMAPNSHFNYPIPLNGQPFKKGIYSVKVTAKSGGRKWQWEETFKIDGQTAKNLNKEDVTIPQRMNWWIVISIVVIMTLLFLVSIQFYRIQTKKKALQKKNVKSKKKKARKLG